MPSVLTEGEGCIFIYSGSAQPSSFEIILNSKELYLVRQNKTTHPKTPQTSCKFLILPATCQQVATNLSLSLSCNKSVKAVFHFNCIVAKRSVFYCVHTISFAWLFTKQWDTLRFAMTRLKWKTGFKIRLVATCHMQTWYNLLKQLATDLLSTSCRKPCERFLQDVRRFVETCAFLAVYMNIRETIKSQKKVPTSHPPPSPNQSAIYSPARPLFRHLHWKCSSARNCRCTSTWKSPSHLVLLLGLFQWRHKQGRLYKS